MRIYGMLEFLASDGVALCAIMLDGRASGRSAWALVLGRVSTE